MVEWHRRGSERLGCRRKMNRRGKREVEIRTAGLGGKISVSLPMKSSRQLGKTPKQQHVFI